MIRSHKELKKTLIDYQIATGFDYIRTFDENYWTDFSISIVTNITTLNSKYLMIGLTKEDSKPFVLYNNNLNDIFNEISERMIRTKEILGYDCERNRVFGYYDGDGAIRFGNKSLENLKIRFEIATVEDVIRKKYYMRDLNGKNRHSIVQTYLISLGKSLGYNVVVAINDRKKILSFSSEQLIVESLNLPDLETKVSKNIVERIDVIWLEKKEVAACFEVEFSDNYAGAFARLSELNTILTEQNIINVIVSEDRKLNNLIQLCNSNYVKALFPKANLFYLSLSKLNDCLAIKDIIGFANELGARRKHFYSENTIYQLLNKK
jgi:hypothetical protein